MYIFIVADIRSIFEDLQPDLLELEAFLIAFGRMHNIDGHSIMCVLTQAKSQAISASYEHEGVYENTSVLLVRDTDMQGMRINDTLRIDGKLYVIMSVSRPSGDIIKLELSGNA